MMGLAITRALFTTPPIVADIDAEKRKTALAAGAAQAYDPSDPQARKAVMSATGGGSLAICDFVGSDKSLQFATGLLASRRLGCQHRAPNNPAGAASAKAVGDKPSPSTR
jgi:threonine dehydrogenase-like Zn-dependent dehydrogenase